MRTCILLCYELILLWQISELEGAWAYLWRSWPKTPPSQKHTFWSFIGLLPPQAPKAALKQIYVLLMKGVRQLERGCVQDQSSRLRFASQPRGQQALSPLVVRFLFFLTYDHPVLIWGLKHSRRLTVSHVCALRILAHHRSPPRMHLGLGVVASMCKVCSVYWFVEDCEAPTLDFGLTVRVCLSKLSRLSPCTLPISTGGIGQFSILEKPSKIEIG